MAPTSLHTIALSPILIGLKNAVTVIAKGEAYAKANNIDPNEYLTASLNPDMADFCYQIYRFTDTAKLIVERISAGNPAISLPDNEKTFPDLLARVKKTIEYVESIEVNSVDGRENEEVVLVLGKGSPLGALEVRFNAIEYVLRYAHPNFWFHVTTMYGILRHKGVPLGKMDYLNGAGLTPIKRLEPEPSAE